MNKHDLRYHSINAIILLVLSVIIYGSLYMIFTEALYNPSTSMTITKGIYLTNIIIRTPITQFFIILQITYSLTKGYKKYKSRPLHITDHGLDETV